MKYAVLLLALMFAGCGGGSSTDEVASTDDLQYKRALRHKAMSSAIAFGVLQAQRKMLTATCS